MKPCPVVHFEIGCENQEKTLKFYTEVFGWSTSKAPHNTKLDTGSDQGINGHLTSLGHEPHQYVQFYIQVDSVSEYIKTVEQAGGKLHIGPLPTGLGEFFAWMNDPEGNMFGLVSKKE
ncbi:MAG: VOC family protein [Cyclobacteriaceae bacterium]